MVSGVDFPINKPPLQVEATTAVAIIQAKQGTILNSTQLSIGKQYQAEVIAKLDDGSYLVNIADTTARMQLPNSQQVGSKLLLTLISTSPRATFLINEEIAPLATQDPKIAQQLPTATTDSAPAVLSQAGKLIGHLLEEMPEQNVVRTTKTPLLDSPNHPPESVARALQNGVSTSGIFYESHLLQWAEGKLDITQLMKEPQANFPSDVPQTALKEATTILQQQLQTMEQQRFVWHGELWSGQRLEWEVSRDNSKQQEGAEQNTWQSAVRFELPALGAVSAQLQLTGNRLNLRINTEDTATTERLQRHADELISALLGTGTKLDTLSIKTKS